jgi:pimeloyl-ACP methyl ester carboxylesterase
MPTQTTDLFLLEDLEDVGAESWGEEAGNGMKPAAAHVQTVVIPGAGHWVAEQAPDRMLAALNAFLAPYREAYKPRPRGPQFAR